MLCVGASAAYADAGPIVESSSTAATNQPRTDGTAPSATAATGANPANAASPPAGARLAPKPAVTSSTNPAIASRTKFSLTQPATWESLFDVSNFSLFDPNSWPFIPIPEVATDPNGGTTVGLIAAFLQHDQNGGIESILAPDLNYNATLGFGGGFRYLAYPSPDRQWYITATANIDKARRVDLYYATGRTREDWWSWEGRFFWENDPTERFFGVGNETPESSETNYMIKQLYAQFMLGFNFNENLQLAIIERPRYVRIGTGAFDSDPFIGALFPTVKGLGGGTEWLTTFLATYDTRDSTDLPRSGGLAKAYWGVADRRFGSSVSYNRFGAEVRRYIPIHDRVTIAGHLYIQYTPAGSETPFWSMARLGGYDSRLWDQQTLRGYGAGRFVDNNLDVANVEVRTRVFDATVFNTHGIVELAPFLEAGKVWHRMSDNPLNRLHPVGGMGFRAIVEPFVVGYVDVGFGSEGPAIFSGINYPF